MAASYPSSAKTFTPVVDGVDYPQATQINQAYDEITALEQALVSSGLAHNLFASATATYDLGTSAVKWRDLFLSRNALIGGTLGVTGIFSVSAGIAFPATQAASSDANTIDDYEEGTWTPVIGGSGGTSGQTYTTQVGLYIKIGQFVCAQFRMLLSAKGTITTNVQIQGLPFTSNTTTSGNAPGASVLWDTLATNWVSIVLNLNPNATAAGVVGANAAAASNATALTTADIQNTTQIYGTICYRASA